MGSGWTKPIEREGVIRVSEASETTGRGFYTPETVRIVADVYAADIEYFGFDFDGPATRRTVTTA